MLQYTWRTLRNVALIAGVTAFAIACDDDDDNNNTNPTPQSMTIADVAAGDPELTTLVTVLGVTGLDATVSDENANLTVFAPTNQAFSDLLDDLGVADLNELVATLGAEAVTNIVKYHVIASKVMSNQLSNGYVTTVGENPRGEMLSMYINIDNGVVINNDAATVRQADINADNGVIHKVDKVILPPTVAGLLLGNPDYATLIAAVQAADASVLGALVDESAAWTLFAPDNDAFGQLLSDLGVSTLGDVVAAVGVDGLTDILFYHVLADEVTSAEVQTGTGVGTALAGSSIDITVTTNGGVEITDGGGRMAMVEEVDIQGMNGVVHRINTVIRPN